MNRRTVAATLITSATLSACVVAGQPAYYAYKANTTHTAKANDYLNCEVEAAQKVPVNQQVGTTPVYTTPTYTTPMYTSCGPYSCTTTGGDVIGGQVYGGNVYSYDANEELRLRVTMQCMQNKGYTIYDTVTCSPSQVPDDLAAKASDVMKKPEGKFCVADVSDRVTVPVAVK